MRLIARLLLLIAVLGWAAPAAAKPDLLILVSIDGFRADYLQRGQTPVLARLARQGVSAAMRPPFPSQTFPSHYTMVTGLYPDHHGIVDNTMDDPMLGHFTMANPDPRWWEEAEPLWITADRQGIRTGTMFWPGSDRAIRGVRPDYWKAYDKDFLADARVDQVLKWLDLPKAERPGFVTLYFDEVDTIGHKKGPDSSELNAALRETDASVGRLVAGLKARGLLARTNLIFVADHGMANTSMQRLVYLDDVVDIAAIHPITGGASASLTIDPAAPPDTEAKLLALKDHVRCWRKGEIPPALHYGTNPRVAPIICLADVGWYIGVHARIAAMKEPLNLGSHGYDPSTPEMAALFVAHGPAFRPGIRLKGVDSVDIQPLAAQLLGIKAPPADGSTAAFKRAITPH